MSQSEPGSPHDVGQDSQHIGEDDNVPAADNDENDDDVSNIDIAEFHEHALTLVPRTMGRPEDQSPTPQGCWERRCCHNCPCYSEKCGPCGWFTCTDCSFARIHCCSEFRRVKVLAAILQ